MEQGTGLGGMICGHCGRPMAAGVSISGRMYHQECTHGPGWQAQPFQPLPPQHYSVPLSDERVRQIVRDELVRAGLVVVRDVMD